MFQKVIQLVFKANNINAINNILIQIIPEIHHPVKEYIFT